MVDVMKVSAGDGKPVLQRRDRARAEVPARLNVSGYPAVEDLPSRGEKTTMTVDERLKLRKELSAARDRQASRAKAKEGIASPSTHEALRIREL
jgi:hypothetical protein